MNDPSSITPPPKKNRIWIIFFAFITIASVGVCVFMIWFNLSIQLKPDQLEEAWDLWKAKGIKNYEMVYTKQLNNDPRIDTFVVQVQAGEVHEVRMNGELLTDKVKTARVELAGLIKEQTKYRDEIREIADVGQSSKLAEMQRKLATRTDELRKSPSLNDAEIGDALKEASAAMNRAATTLDVKRFQEAVAEQDKAIESLQKARRELPGDPRIHHSMDRLFNDIERFLTMDQKPGAPKVYAIARFDSQNGALLHYVRRVMGTSDRVEINVKLKVKDK